MAQREYKTVAMPQLLSGRRRRGQSHAEMVAEIVSSVINKQSAAGWSYAGADSFRTMERAGLFGRPREAVYTVLIFERALREARAEPPDLAIPEPERRDERPRDRAQDRVQDRMHDRAHDRLEPAARAPSRRAPPPDPLAAERLNGAGRARRREPDGFSEEDPREPAAAPGRPRPPIGAPDRPLDLERRDVAREQPAASARRRPRFVDDEVDDWEDPPRGRGRR